MRALIVDDEPLARQRIRQLLKAETDIELVGEAGNGTDAVRLIEELSPNLVFLDVQMPELDGFGVVDAVGVDRMPATLFVTAYDKHAVRAFEVHALDYLLKPFNRERFQTAIERVREWLGRPVREPLPFESLLADIRQEGAIPDRFLVRAGERYLIVKAGSIQWIEAEDNYVRLHLEGESPLLRQTMSGILERLDARQFRRIHRSSIVNLDFIKELQPWTGGDMIVIMRDGTRLTLSRSYRARFEERL